MTGARAWVLVLVLACACTVQDVVAEIPGTESDAAASGDGVAPPATGCAFVDLLVVADNSSSNNNYVEALASASPQIVDALYGRLPIGVELHAGVTTTSFFDGNCDESVVNCVTAASAADIAAHYVTPDEQNLGTNGGQGRLLIHEGRSYYTATISAAGDRAALATWLAGAVAAVGDRGCTFEMMAAAAGYVVHPANAATNDGFVRDERAILAVLIVTDEPDKSPEGTAAYRDLLVAAKSGCGGDDCIVAVGLVDACIKDVGNSLWEFLNAFGEPPVWGSASDTGEYPAVAGDALADAIAQACARL